MTDSLWTFVFELANFVALAALLGWLFFKPVRQALEDQRAKTRQLEDDANKKLADAESMRRDIEARQQTFDRELEALRARLRDNAKQEAEQIIAEARAQAERELAAAKRDALHIEQAQMTRIARAVAITTQKAISRFLQQMNGPELNQALTKKACQELATLAGNSLAPVTIESAAPLDDNARRMIESALGAAASSADFRVNAELEGGLSISTAHGLIDASVKGLANFAEQELAAEMESVIREDARNE